MLIEFTKPDFEFCDDRGSLTQLVHQDWKQINYIFSKANVVRGNHYHKENIEAFYVISGEFKLDIFDKISNITEHYEMKTGDFFIIKPNLVHSFEYTKDTQLISMYDIGVEKIDGSKDIFTL